MEICNPRLSFVVPFYNVEEYISQCLDSIFAQDVPESQYEVICIDDCSPDNSLAIVNQYQSIHPNLRIIQHKTNLKLGAARNTGLKASQGSYVWFVDSDDFIEENCLSEVIGECEKNNLDILHFSIQNHKSQCIRAIEPTGVLTGAEEEMVMYKQKCIEVTYPWNRVYKRAFLLENNLLFNDLYGGDVIHTIQALDTCKRIKNVNRFFYYYRTDNTTSDTRSSISAKKIFDMYLTLGKEVNECCLSTKSELKKLVCECGPWRFNQTWKQVIKLPIREKVLFAKLCRGNQDIVEYALRFCDKKNRFVLNNIHLVVLFSPFLYLIIKMKNGIKYTPFFNSHER